ncbi:GNAT family N-acetyltransferase [Chitinophaga lutea]
MTTEIIYQADIIPDIELIISLYEDAGLKRPINDKDRIRRMFSNSNLVVTAWHNDVLAGVSRAMADYGYWCYLADLAVRTAYQGKGVGRRLIDETRRRAGEDCMLVLLSAPSALTYYPGVGLRNLNNAFALDRQA